MRCLFNGIERYTMVVFECLAIGSIAVVIAGEIYLLKKMFSDNSFPYINVKNSAAAIKGDFN